MHTRHALRFIEQNNSSDWLEALFMTSITKRFLCLVLGVFLMFSLRLRSQVTPLLRKSERKWKGCKYTKLWLTTRWKLLFTFCLIEVAFHKFASVQTGPKYYPFILQVGYCEFFIRFHMQTFIFLYRPCFIQFIKVRKYYGVLGLWPSYYVNNICLSVCFSQAMGRAKGKRTCCSPWERTL